MDMPSKPVLLIGGVVVLVLLLSRRGGGGTPDLAALASSTGIAMSQIAARDNETTRRYMAESEKIRADLSAAQMNSGLTAWLALTELDGKVKAIDASLAGARIAENGRLATARIEAKREVDIARIHGATAARLSDAEIKQTAIRSHYGVAQTATTESMRAHAVTTQSNNALMQSVLGAGRDLALASIY